LVLREDLLCVYDLIEHTTSWPALFDSILMGAAANRRA